MKNSKLLGVRFITFILNVMSWLFFVMALSNHTFWHVTGDALMSSFVAVLLANGASLLVGIYTETSVTAEALTRLLRKRDKE